MLRIILKSFAVIAGFLILLVIFMFLFMMITEFRPDPLVQLEVAETGKPLDPGKRTFSLISWNIGYAGMDQDADFFYDGGKMVNPSEKASKRNLMEIKRIIQSFDTMDFILLQEIDRKSKRSWDQDQYLEISSALPGMASVFATNYRCRYIPAPLNDPMGYVDAGIAMFTKEKPEKALARYFDVNFPWPYRLVFLKRCFMMLFYPLNDGKELVVINTHNSAFDSTGELRRRELFLLDSAMRSEYRKGNYVIAGGDWNTNPRGFEPDLITTGDKAAKVDELGIAGFFDGWSVVYDTQRPSNRFVNRDYQKGTTLVTTIDFFVLSPNVHLDTISVLPMEFKWSDHEPVIMTITLQGKP